MIIISELMDDIAAMRNTIAYFEYRILNKQIAIQELIHSSETEPERRPIDDLILKAVPEINGPPFIARELINKVEQMNPGSQKTYSTIEFIEAGKRLLNGDFQRSKT